jgi:hypothetical protein
MYGTDSPPKYVGSTISEAYMRITLGQIKQAESALGTLTNQALPIQTAFRISRLIRQVVSEITDLEEHRKKLVEKFGMTDPNTGITTVTDENLPLFSEALRPLLETEVTLNFDKLGPKDLPESFNISSSDILQLEPFIDFV